MLYMLAAGISFVIAHTIISQTTRDLHPFEVAFFRNAFGFIAFLPLMARTRFHSFRTQRIGLHFSRSLVNAGAMMCFYVGLSMAPLAEATALTFTTPLFATIGAIVVLGERIRVRRLAALVIGFLGAFVVLRPGFTTIELGAVAVLVSQVFWAIAMIDIKILSRTDSSLTIATYMNVFLMPITLLPALFFWQWPSLDQLFWLFMIGVLGSTGQYLLTESFRLADVSALLPLDFTKLIWASALGYWFLGQTPDLWVWIGGFMIFAGSTYIAIRERRLKVEPPLKA
jgi:drug/metabolite transporter (DMT)-like permease